MLNPTVSKIYHSREDRIADLHDESDRLAYNNEDTSNISDLIDVVDDYGAKLVTKMEKFEDLVRSEQSEDHDRDLDYARRDMIENWALAQASLSKVAWFFRFDGNIAYERMINALKTGQAADMRGL